MVRTGAAIITGDTARAENASAVLEALSEMAGEFVVATAGAMVLSGAETRIEQATSLEEERLADHPAR